MSSVASASSRRKSSGMAPAKDQTRLRIEKMEADRELRRLAMIERKKQRAKEEQRNLAAGNPGDVDFIGMVRQWRREHADTAKPHEDESQAALCVCVRKRPVSDKERAKSDHDSVTCFHPVVWIHSAKFKVDGITKYLDHASFRFDHAFDETASTDEVYKHTTMPLLDFVCSGEGGRATVFAYGQTGSGKTHTMSGIQRILGEDLFLLLSEAAHVDGPCTTDNTMVMVSFFELYGGFVQDLMNERKRLKVMEDGKGEIIVTGLSEVEVEDPDNFSRVLDEGNSARTTHMTEANDESSRSHAICQITLRHRLDERLLGKFSLVDLAGSERGSDTKSHNSHRRAESSDINASLLALKECIRALGMNKKGPKHVPYRSSKLTLILKDCFTSPKSMTTMIATISPGASSADHSINTLRYADRIKEQRAPGQSIRKSSTARPSKQQRGGVKKVERPVVVLAINNEPESPELDEMDSFLDEELGASNSLNSAVETQEDGDDLLTLEQDDLDDNDLDREDEEEEWAATEEEVGDAEPEGSNGENKETSVFASEEGILNCHMANIQENAELLTMEGDMLQEIQRNDVTEADFERYATALEMLLDRKEDMILSLQEKIVAYHEQTMMARPREESLLYFK